MPIDGILANGPEPSPLRAVSFNCQTSLQIFQAVELLASPALAATHTSV